MITSPTSALGPAKKGARVAGRDGPTRSVRAGHIEMMWDFARVLVFGIVLTRASCDLFFGWLGGGDGGMGVGAVVNALAIALAFALLARRPMAAPFAVFAIWGPLLLIALIAALRAPDVFSASRMAMGILSYWALFALPFLIWRGPGDLTRFIVLVIGSSVVPSLYALVDIGQGLSDWSDFRLQSTFAHANIYAFYLVLLIGLVLYVRSSRMVDAPARVKRLLMLYVPYLLVLLVLTGTRSAWAACALMLLVYALRIDRRFFAALLLAPVLFAANPAVLNRLTELTKAPQVDSFKQLNETTTLNSYVWRTVLWESAIPQVLEEPLLGHGLETFKPSTPSFFPLIGPQGIDAHNFYLQAAFEMGLLGLFALFWMLGCVAWMMLTGRRRDPEGVVIALSILAGYALESYSDNMQFYLAFNWGFWFAIGTFCAWAHSAPRAPREKARAMVRNAAPYATLSKRAL